MALKHLGFQNLAAVLVLGGAIVGFTSKVALAQPAGPEVGASGRLVSGASDFRQYCAQCHGLKGVGDGPVAPALAKKPANLTLLSKNNGGVFPEQEVYNFIDEHWNQEKSKFDMAMALTYSSFCNYINQIY